MKLIAGKKYVWFFLVIMYVSIKLKYVIHLNNFKASMQAGLLKIVFGKNLYSNHKVNAKQHKTPHDINNKTFVHVKKQIAN